MNGAGALQGAVRARQADWAETPPVIRTDNGPQFIAQAWAKGCEALGLAHERIPNATPNKNAHIESWHSLLEADCWRKQIRSLTLSTTSLKSPIRTIQFPQKR